MKKIYLCIGLVFLFNLAKAQFPAPYCDETYVTNVEPITSVVFGSINNASPAAVNTTTPHQDFTSISTTVAQGLAYNITVKGNTDGNYSDYISVFVDWDQNGDFSGSDEVYNIGIIKNSTGLDAISVSGSILVPASATIGATRMRVAKHYNSYQNPCNAGTSGQYGEAEDYTLNVIAPTNCSGAPPVTTAYGPSSFCQDSMITVSINVPSASVGLTYQWQYTTIGGTNWTDVAGAIDATSTFVQLAGGVDYRCKVTCSSQSTYSTKLTVASEDCGPPANDDPCDAITLVLDGPSDCKNTEKATSVNDPSFSACSTPNNTVWYKYTPSVSGVVIVTFTIPATTGSTLNGWLGVYSASGSCPGGLSFTNETATALGGCKSFGTDTVTKISANLNAGTDYYFMIDGVSGAIGKFCIALKTAPAPPATCVTNVLPIDASVDVSAPNTLLRWSTVANATSYDLYFGTTNPPTTKITTTALDSILVTGMAYSTTYYWYVVPVNLGGSPTGCDANTTSFTTMATPPPPNNDDCDSAVNVLPGTIINGSTISATQTMAAQSCSGFTGTADDDVWFMFTATQSGDADITLVPVGTSFDAVVVAYSGTCGGLTQIGCADTSFGGGTEIVHLTGLNAGETYYFRVYSYSSSATGQGTFKISVTGDAVLPVSLTQFMGEKKGTGNLLFWTTATENNNKGFELQRSYNGNDFLSVNFIASKAKNGNSTATLNYQFTDAKPFAGITYYRLKQIDLNGKATLSNVVAIKGDKVTNLTVTDVYPNPATKVLNVVVNSPVEDRVNIIVTDITGKIVKTQAAQVSIGNNNAKMDVSNLANGTYLMKVICTNGCTSATTKFVKQ